MLWLFVCKVERIVLFQTHMNKSTNEDSFLKVLLRCNINTFLYISGSDIFDASIKLNGKYITLKRDKCMDMQ